MKNLKILKIWMRVKRQSLVFGLITLSFSMITENIELMFVGIGLLILCFYSNYKINKLKQSNQW